MVHHERHRVARLGWLRASVLGANDGLISTSSLILGIAAANASAESIVLAGAAGLVAGALSMAAGEYVSVQSQADTEHADIAKERHELASDPDSEHAELTAIYAARGLDAALARQVATQLMAADPLTAHLRDELGITDTTRARPLQAALASAGAFSLGAALPLLLAVLWPHDSVVPAIIVSTCVLLAALGALAARLGGAVLWRGAVRVLFWGALAMAATTLIGTLFGAAPVA